MQQTLPLGGGFGVPAVDLGMPSPHEGSFCCEKRLQAADQFGDHFSVCYVGNCSILPQLVQEGLLHGIGFWFRHRHHVHWIRGY